MLGLSLEAFTALHVAVSLVAMAAGAWWLAAVLARRPDPARDAAFLSSTILTSVTGFLFPAGAILPSHVVGAISLVLLALACYALYARALAGRWRTAYAASATAAFYLNVFVGVVQAFQKVPALQALAPTQAEPPFAIAQAVVLAAFVAIGWAANRALRAA
jgi:hypothetical protein